MKFYETLEKEILSAVTPELNEQYFVLSEYLQTYNGVFIGRDPTKEGFGDSAMIYGYPDKGSPKHPVTSLKTFEEVKNYYENIVKGYKVYKLREGIEVMFRERQMPVDYESNFTPELKDKIEEWFDAWCDYKSKFTTVEDKEQHLENIYNLGVVLENAVKNVEEVSLSSLSTFLLKNSSWAFRTTDVLGCSGVLS